VWTADPLDPAALTAPYDGYTDRDIAHRLLYVESSRGCPYNCAFCLSSLDRGVRLAPLGPFLTAMERLIARGARQFKFVDRTANADAARMTAILDFFQERWHSGMRLHFEVLPDRLPQALLERIGRFPDGGLHLEVGVQSFSETVLEAIQRPQDLDATEAALRFLRQRTGALLHADLVAGLPYETWETFAEGFDRLWALQPHAIQVGILKRLKGTPILAYERMGALRFAPRPPYAVVATHTLTAGQIDGMKRFARVFDVYYNSGNFPRSLDFVMATAPSPFDAFMAFTHSLWDTFGRGHGISLFDQTRFLYVYVLERMPGIQESLADAVERDYRRRPGRKERLDFLIHPTGLHT